MHTNVLFFGFSFISPLFMPVNIRKDYTFPYPGLCAARRARAIRQGFQLFLVSPRASLLEHICSNMYRKEEDYTPSVFER